MAAMRRVAVVLAIGLVAHTAGQPCLNPPDGGDGEGRDVLINCTGASLTTTDLSWPANDIEMLVLAHNAISTIVSGSFGSLDELSLLDLSWNHVSVVQASDFAGLTSLEILNLQSNRLTTVGQDSFAALTSLEMLNLSGNRISEILRFAFIGLTGLVDLNLHSNDLTFVHRLAMEPLNSTRVLRLGSNRLTNISFGPTPRLRFLRVQNNSIAQITRATILAYSHVNVSTSRNVLRFSNASQLTVPNGCNAPSPIGIANPLRIGHTLTGPIYCCTVDTVPCGVPMSPTLVPHSPPTTSAPQFLSPTLAPTVLPTTRHPDSFPPTRAPRSPSPTRVPTVLPITRHPDSYAPTRASQSPSPTRVPSVLPTTRHPDSATPSPSLMSTETPTAMPTTRHPESMTLSPTASPTPSPIQTTRAPTASTTRPTRRPTIAEPPTSTPSPQTSGSSPKGGKSFPTPAPSVAPSVRPQSSTGSGGGGSSDTWLIVAVALIVLILVTGAFYCGRRNRAKVALPLKEDARGGASGVYVNPMMQRSGVGPSDGAAPHTYGKLKTTTTTTTTSNAQYATLTREATPEYGRLAQETAPREATYSSPPPTSRSTPYSSLERSPDPEMAAHHSGPAYAYPEVPSATFYSSSPPGGDGGRGRGRGRGRSSASADPTVGRGRGRGQRGSKPTARKKHFYSPNTPRSDSDGSPAMPDNRLFYGSPSGVADRRSSEPVMGSVPPQNGLVGIDRADRGPFYSSPNPHPTGRHSEPTISHTFYSASGGFGDDLIVGEEATQPVYEVVDDDPVDEAPINTRKGLFYTPSDIRNPLSEDSVEV
eukprot:m.453212 g.453212  ORF g.453212 m.453212 type:complete len:817 (+) comp20457_c0_seq1:214-2664(+)